MSEDKEWKTVFFKELGSQLYEEHLQKLAVPGGWIYKTTVVTHDPKTVLVSTCFVPATGP